ncbi:MAG: hypothetical protein ACREJQ_07835, partial [bacterium]
MKPPAAASLPGGGGGIIGGDSGGDSIGGGGGPESGCSLPAPALDEFYPPTFVEPTSPQDLQEWVEARPLIQACLYDAAPFSVSQVHMRVDLKEVPATYDPETHLVSYTPTSDLSEGTHYISVFVLFTTQFTAERTWMFRSDYDNPRFQFVQFPFINGDPSQINSQDVTVSLLKRYDPQYHLTPSNWRATHKDTLITYHPDIVTSEANNIVKLHFITGGGLPDKNPQHYEWALGGKPGKPEQILPSTGDDPPPTQDPPWCNGPTISLWGKNDAEDSENHWWGVNFTPVQVPPGTRGFYRIFGSYNYWFNPADKEFSYPKAVNNQP